MFDHSDRYFWLFDSSKIASLTNKYALGNSAGKKYRFLYTFNNQYRYWIFEDAKLNNVPLDRIKDTMVDISSSKVYINPSTFNDMGWGGHIFFESRLCTDSSNSLLLNFDTDSEVEKVNDSNIVSFTGMLTNVLIQNENIENEYLLKYDRPTQTAIYFYKPMETLYVIVVNPFEGRKDIDLAIQNLNLR